MTNQDDTTLASFSEELEALSLRSLVSFEKIYYSGLNTHITHSSVLVSLREMTDLQIAHLPVIAILAALGGLKSIQANSDLVKINPESLKHTIFAVRANWNVKSLSLLGHILIHEKICPKTSQLFHDRYGVFSIWEFGPVCSTDSWDIQIKKEIAKEHPEDAEVSSIIVACVLEAWYFTREERLLCDRMEMSQ